MNLTTGTRVGPYEIVDVLGAVLKTLALAAGESDERGYAEWLEANVHRGG